MVWGTGWWTTVNGGRERRRWWTTVNGDRTRRPWPTTANGDRRRRRWWPRSVRARSALAAGAAAAFILAGLGAWVHNALYDQQMAATRAQATSEMDRLLDQLDRGYMPGGFGPLPYEVVVAGRQSAGEASTDLVRLGSLQRHLLPAPAHRDVWAVRTVSIPRPPDGTASDDGLTGRTLQALTADFDVDDVGRAKAKAMDIGNSVVRVYVLLAPAAAEQATASADRILLPVAIAGVAMVAAVAYLATRLALRPVEAIRARTAQVTAAQPRERVEVPDTGDEIAALARTINDTLERLDTAAAQQRRFVADAAHELRSPLTTVLTSLEVALAYPDRTDWPAAVHTAVRQTRRLRSLTEDLLLLARLDADAPRPPAVPVDIAAIAHELTDEYASLGPSPAVDGEAPEPALVTGSADELERLLRNLLDNATRHAAHRVRVIVRVQGDEVTATVQDDGPGIPPADAERIFERFTRLDDHRARTTGGTGLGLAIARELAHRHHGTLTLAENSTGACFEARLPRTPKPPSPQPA
ncbi:sensor histidine kinase [Streptomyces sp. NPDC059629]|uniref:sensor histidine kinase n=1 Tax=Streptomyces sp. NPDC059629 TaxID=3346889 RepID=UPI0036CC2D26